MVSLRARASMSTIRRVASRDFTEIRRWPHDPTIAHLVLLDVDAAPTVDQIATLTGETFASDDTLRSIRTSALFPGTRDHFAAAGYEVCERLALLDRPIDRVEPLRAITTTARPANIALRRLQRRRLDEAARIDRSAFPAGWSNSADTLADIALATPRHLGRLAVADGRAVGFAITGLGGSVGYLQRLAVDPDRQRRGIARLLVDDALVWLQRRGAATVLVNTAVDNDAALRLYESLGFQRRRDELVVMEHRR